METKIAIVGAGISGLLACKYTLSKGFVPIVFESQNSIGGVWTKTMDSTKLQTPKQAFMFSDFPWPSSVTEDFPNHHQVLEYVQSYASHFDLLKHIKFNTTVVSLTYDGPSEEKIRSWTLWEGDHAPFGLNQKWKVHVEDLTKHVNDVRKALQPLDLGLLFSSNKNIIIHTEIQAQASRFIGSDAKFSIV